MNNYTENDFLSVNKPSTLNRKQSQTSSNSDRINNTNTINTSSKQIASNLVQERISYHEKHHKKLREFIMDGLAQVREDLLPLLYYSYLRLYLNILRENLPTQLIKRWRNDFINIDSFAKELDYLDSISHSLTEEKMKKDQGFVEIFTSRRVIYMSQFTFESLFLFIQKNNLQQFDFDVLQRINLEIDNEATSDPHKKTSVSLSGKEILNLTEERIRPGIRKDEALFMHLLQGIQKAKKHEGADFSLGKLGKYIPPFAREVQEETTIPLPETKLKFQIDYAKAFLNSFSYEKPSEPNILHISVKDPYENITCMEIHPLGNILLVGFNNAKILMIVLNPKFRESTDAFEGYIKESLNDLTSALDTDPIVIEEEDSPKNDESKMALENHEEGNGGLFGEYSDKEQSNQNNKTSQGKYEIIEFIGHDDAITSINLHYDEQYFLSSSVDTTVRLWCIRQRTCLGIFKGHVNSIWTVKFASRGFLFVSGSSDKTARLWQTGNVFAIRAFAGHTSDVHLADFSNDCNYVVTASYDKSIRLWEVNNSQCFKILYPGSELISAIKLNFYSNLLATGLEDGTVVIWDLTKDQKLCSFISDEDNKRINSLDFSPDSKGLVVSSRKRITTYDVRSFQNIIEQKNKAEEERSNNEHDKKQTSNNKEDRIEKNSLVFEEGGNTEYSILLTRFSAGNFVYALSRSVE